MGLLGVSLYGIEDIPSGSDKLQQRRNSEMDQNSVVARRQDLAFVMYTDQDIAEVILVYISCNYGDSYNRLSFYLKLI